MTKVFVDSYLVCTSGIVIFPCFQQTKSISVNAERLRQYFSEQDFEDLVLYEREIMCAQLDRYQHAVTSLGENSQGICSASVFFVLWHVI